MKKIIAILLAMLLLDAPYVQAAQDGYVVRLKAGAIPPASANAEALFPEADVWLFQNRDDIVSCGDAVLSYSPNKQLPLCSPGGLTEDPYARFQWHLPAIHAEYARKWDVRGQGITVAILDTGINRNSEDFDPDMILPGYSFIANYPETETTDGVGHGTFVSGLIAAQGENGRLGCGIADRVKILPVRIASGPMLTTAWLISGLRYAMENGADVVNMSLGAGFEMPEVAACLDVLRQKKILLIGAAGNSGNSTPDYPSCYPGVISVGGITPDRRRALYSSYGSTVTCVAPSTALFSLSNKRNDAMAYGGSGGTSYAAPIVTGVAALAKCVDPELDYDGFTKLLEKTCEDLGLPGYDIEYGYGLVNIEDMLEEQFASLPSPVAVYDCREEGEDLIYSVRNVGEPISVTLRYTASDDKIVRTETVELTTGVQAFSFPKGEGPTLEILSADGVGLASR